MTLDGSSMALDSCRPRLELPTKPAGMAPRPLTFSLRPLRAPTDQQGGAALPSLTTPPLRLPSLLPSPPRAPEPSVATTSTSPADERTLRDLAARLALLLHARECCRGGSGDCKMRNCGVARGVLDHCQECFLADGQCHVSCAQAKRLLRHFRVCRARGFPPTCKLCCALRSEFPWALRHADSLSPVFLSPSRVCRAASDESEYAARIINRPIKRRRSES